MRARLNQEMEITHPDLQSMDDVRRLEQLFLSRQITQDEFLRKRRVRAAAGTVIEHPEAWRLCFGPAEPFDAECVAAVGRATLKRHDRLVEKYAKLENAQLSGTAIDASAEAVAAFQQDRAARRDKLQEAPAVVAPAF